ncbi:MAG: deoxyribose-phosphate aldolase [Cryobacterium sp.]|nr:deoxyribose-phosphate aldolase [Oligoflexia bacterium]
MKSLREEILTALHSLGQSSEEASANSADLSGTELARFIDHTLLKAGATSLEIEKICQEALLHRFASVCVNTSQIEKVASLLSGQSTTLPIAVVGFPLGAMDSKAKAAETRRAVELGAREIDMVIAIGSLKDRDYVRVESDIREVVQAASGHPVKVILETCLLSHEEKVIACVVAKRAGAAFVKTSTGFSTGGATLNDVKLMRRVVGPSLGVKASGGIRSREDALQMIQAGATRLGASSSVSIVGESSTPAPRSKSDSGY